MKQFFILFYFLLTAINWAQLPAPKTKDTLIESPFKTGFYPISFFDIDLRYLVKYNDYEGFRLGFGGFTNDKLFKKIRLGGYVAYGFKDHRYKYKIGAGIRIHKKHRAWANISYINDIQEVGSHAFLTDKLVYSVFEPRLVNIKQFYKHQTWQVNIQNNLISFILSELRFSKRNIQNILNYSFLYNNKLYNTYKLSEITLSTRFSFSEQKKENNKKHSPVISFQITKGLKNVLQSNFNYTKVGLEINYLLKRKSELKTTFLAEGNWATGDVPLTQLFHAYPNSPTKDEILQRFSVTGTHSFETMYFGEFFSDKIATLQIKHTVVKFNLSKRSKPEVTLTTRHAIGALSNPERHTGITFNTLNNIYSESGIEINQLLFGFGLSFNYRYGYYYLNDFEDNISFKFTFNLKL